ncbi:MAG: tail protein X [Caulobacteraceae bacterium]
METSSYFEYTTMQGDTFDILALDAYNDEFKAHLIIEANPQYANVVIFDGGIILKIPIIQQEAAATLPPWKR